MTSKTRLTKRTRTGRGRRLGYGLLIAAGLILAVSLYAQGPQAAKPPGSDPHQPDTAPIPPSERLSPGELVIPAGPPQRARLVRGDETGDDTGDDPWTGGEGKGPRNRLVLPNGHTFHATSLMRMVGVSSGQVIQVSIPVKKGEVIGILGATGDSAMMHNSYGTNYTFTSAIFGEPVTLRRLGMQYNLTSYSARNLWTENYYVSRVKMFYAQ